MFFILKSVVRIFPAYHLFMEFFSWSNSHNFLPTLWRHRTSKIGHSHGWNFFDINFTTDHVFKSVPNQLYALLQRDHEARHTVVGNG